MSTPISPKVTASTVTAILVTSILANVSLITPELFAGLGAYGPLIYGVIIAAAGALAGWWKTDPLRGKTVPAESVPGPMEPEPMPDLTPAEPAEVTPVYDATLND